MATEGDTSNYSQHYPVTSLEAVRDRDAEGNSEETETEEDDVTDDDSVDGGYHACVFTTARLWRTAGSTN